MTGPFLDAPGNEAETSGKYSCQMVVSWPIRSGFFDESSLIAIPPTNPGRICLIKRFAETWAEPFRSMVGDIPESTDVKSLELHDWPPPKGSRGTGRVALVGDSFHPMAMYRGEGANHAIVDVLDLVELAISHVFPRDSGMLKLREALDRYEDAIGARARPAVFASRQACLDAHSWASINEKSPLLSRRIMRLAFAEDDQ
ncbi:hypothetical protein SLS62_011004 [Diatrype stigma]|uniref:FAD-binding domain-containing protein n=1 Tax=Diatrype stigma TaxID=117547 RepID=A0AAN9YGE9_9PEZI